VIEEDDDLIGAAVGSNGNELLLSTKLGMACRFDLSDEQIRPMGRSARGVTGMRFKLEGDEIVSLEVIREQLFDEVDTSEDEDVIPEESADGTEPEEFGSGPEVLVVTDGGMGKRSYVANYRKTNRGAKGVVSMRLREGENVLSVIQVDDKDEILLTTQRGQLVRIPASEIRRIGRVGRGVKIMNLNDGDKITGVAKLQEVKTTPAPAEAAAEAEVPATEPETAPEN
jgi:DNA gyrase subunit A